VNVVLGRPSGRRLRTTTLTSGRDRRKADLVEQPANHGGERDYSSDELSGETEALRTNPNSATAGATGGADGTPAEERIGEGCCPRCLRICTTVGKSLLASLLHARLRLIPCEA
jgi:hypothetical protein